jgi:hypothetical protein
MKHETIEFTCDCCGAREGNKEKLKAWAVMLLDDHYEERKWHTKHFCNSCLIEISKLKTGGLV